jgi:hypothetical protein
VQGEIVDFELSPQATKPQRLRFRFSFVAQEPEDTRRRTGELEIRVDDLLAQGLDPRPVMLVGARVWVRYLPDSPWVFRVAGFVDGTPDPCAASRKRTD